MNNIQSNDLPITKKTNDAGETKTAPSIVVSTDTTKLLTKKEHEPTVQYYVKFLTLIHNINIR